MIFLSLGTHEQAFDRAIDLIEPIAGAGEDVVVQHGATPPRDVAGVEWIKFVEYARMVELMVASRGYVCHAGVGSIMTALKHSVVPVVLPREARLGEHVDDHQRQLCDRFASRGLVVIADERGLDVALAETSRMSGTSRGPGRELGRAVERASDRRGRVAPTHPLIGAVTMARRGIERQRARS